MQGAGAQLPISDALASGSPGTTVWVGPVAPRCPLICSHVCRRLGFRATLVVSLTSAPPVSPLRLPLPTPPKDTHHMTRESCHSWLSDKLQPSDPHSGSRWGQINSSFPLSQSYLPTFPSFPILPPHFFKNSATCCLSQKLFPPAQPVAVCCASGPTWSRMAHVPAPLAAEPSVRMGSKGRDNALSGFSVPRTATNSWPRSQKPAS